MSWRLAKSLEVLRGEVNAAAPNRSTVSDGTVGDTSHQARPSDHNPNSAGAVRAIDLTDDPERGLDCNALAAYLTDRMGEHPALTSGAYVIWRGRIFSFDRRAEGWRTYSGSNPHDKHLHLSAATSAAGYDSTAPWGWGEKEDDMPLTDEDVQKVAAAAVKALLTTKIDLGAKGSRDDRSVEQVLKELWNKRNV